MNEKQKNILREMVNYTCQNCKKTETEVGKLEVHRITRGNKGGEYTPNNILMLCKKCHQAIHGEEW